LYWEITINSRKYLQITVYSIVNTNSKRRLFFCSLWKQSQYYISILLAFKRQDETKNIPKIKLVNPYLEAYVCTLIIVNTTEIPCRASNSILETVTVEV